jgi:hypothetical protein
MTDELDRALDELLPRCDDAFGDWDDVLRRAGATRAVDVVRPLPQRRRVAVAVAAAVAVAVVATALAAGLGHRFSAWLGGKPGTPAPAGLQRGFDTRNRAAYAGFPAGTKLRLLTSERLGGTTFSLLGFRNGDAYCLRLVRADRPGAIGRNECLRAEELSDVPALVAADAWFSVGVPARNVNGVYGFAADDVKAVEIERLRGSETVPVVNNVFLSLTSARAGTVQDHPLPNPVLAVRAHERDGRGAVTPYVSGSFMFGLVPNGARPLIPSYFARPRRRPLPGPSTVQAPIVRPTIAWLKRREARGRPLPPQRFSHFRFGRVIQPDPDDPVALGLSVGRRGALCEYYFAPLEPRAAGMGCGPWFRNGAIQLGMWLASPITHFNGVVADGITHVTAFLASGRVLQAALKDNVFIVAFPQAELPGRIVGYDAQNRVAGIVELPGNGVLRACPRPAFTTPVSKLPAPRPWERLDLATMTVNGASILGATPAQVEAALGPPSVKRPREQAYRYGGTLPSTVGLTVAFANVRGALRANQLSFQSPSLVDARLGHVLRLDPLMLQREIAQTYGGRYRTYLSYGSNPGFGCTATLKRRGAASGLSIGLSPARPSRPYLVLRANAY